MSWRILKRAEADATSILPVRKRSNSLTDITPTGSDSNMQGAAPVESQLYKTRSSTSLDDLKKSVILAPTHKVCYV